MNCEVYPTAWCRNHRLFKFFPSPFCIYDYTVLLNSAAEKQSGLELYTEVYRKLTHSAYIPSILLEYINSRIHSSKVYNILVYFPPTYTFQVLFHLV